MQIYPIDSQPTRKYIAITETPMTRYELAKDLSEMNQFKISGYVVSVELHPAPYDLLLWEIVVAYKDV